MIARRLALPVFIAAFVAGFAYLMLNVFTTFGDNDKYGKLHVPGEKQLHLDAGGVLLSFEARLNLGSDSSIRPPGDLQIQVRELATGKTLDLKDARHTSSYQYNSLDGTSIYSFDAPAAGDYGIVARSSQASGYPDAALTLGPNGSIGSTFTRSGLIIALGVALAGVLRLIGNAAHKRTAIPLQPTAPTPNTQQPIPNTPRDAVPGTPDPDPAKELERLKHLWQMGEITEQAYEQRRSAVVDSL